MLEYKKIMAITSSVDVKCRFKNLKSLLAMALFSSSYLANALPTQDKELRQQSTVIANKASKELPSNNDEYPFPIAQPEKLAKKLYRKALFYYFQGQADLALQQLTYNKARLKIVDDNALLFEAGLQVSLGLYRQAEENLTALTDKLAASSEQLSSAEQAWISSRDNKRIDYFASKDLLAVALLQLAEQQINQQQQVKAKQTLAKLSHVPEGYYQQYHILSQLAFWPQPAQLHLQAKKYTAAQTIEHKQAQAYILLNTALLHLEQRAFEYAEKDLIKLKQITWQVAEKSFWQQLFSSENAAAAVSSSEHEQQSLKDYASLLLAQLYIEQQQFSLAYKELAHFPQNSPFTEQALFLFAYASLKTQHYDESEAIFNLVSTRYPANYLGWQADILLARQYLAQRELDTALSSYLHLESKYQQQLASLAQFEQQVVSGSAQFNRTIMVDDIEFDSTWWQKAQASIKLTGHLEYANELSQLKQNLAQQQQQVQWLNYAISINEQRQQNIIAQQQAKNYQASIKRLQARRDQLSHILLAVAEHNDGEKFASGKQIQWLQRISKSQKIIDKIANYQSGQKKFSQYQQRLKRVEGVLAWQLQQEFPQRLWQHRQQLQQLDKLLVKLQQQMQQVNNIQALAKHNSGDSSDDNLNSHSLQAQGSLLGNRGLDLPQLKQKQHRLVQQHNHLVQATTELDKATDNNIQAQLLAFIAEQRQSLNYYLHHSRRAMAKILEEQRKVDNADNIAPSKSANVGAKG